MSTNYYFIPPAGQPFVRRHIGKSWWAGSDVGASFTWAIDPREFARLLVSQPALQVGDSYSEVVPIAQFQRDVLDHIKAHHVDMVGQEFS